MDGYGSTSHGAALSLNRYNPSTVDGLESWGCGQETLPVGTQLHPQLSLSRQSDLHPMQEGPGPEGGRGARLVWVCGGDYILVSGFDR